MPFGGAGGGERHSDPERPSRLERVPGRAARGADRAGLVMIEPREIEVEVNGERRRGRCEPRMTLVDFLRDSLGLTGTHAGCEHGVCGACTVLLDGEAVRSCLMFAVQAEGAKITTVEGLAPQGRMNDLQQVFQRHHALQCGCCTAG